MPINVQIHCSHKKKKKNFRLLFKFGSTRSQPARIESKFEINTKSKHLKSTRTETNEKITEKKKKKH